MQRRDVLAGALTTAFAYATVIPGIFVVVQNDGELNLAVPFPPGGGEDKLARSVLGLIEEKARKKIVVSNIPDLGKDIGVLQLLEDTSNGTIFEYVTADILWGSSSLSGNQSIDSSSKLLPAGQLSKMALVLGINPKALPEVTDFETLIKYAKEHPKAVSFTSSGKGTISHLACELLAQEAGLELVYASNADGISAIGEVISGRVPLLVDAIPNVLTYIKEGSLKAIAVTSNERVPVLPEVPTLEELGLKDYDIYTWDGFVFPNGALQGSVNKISLALLSLKNDPVARETIEMLGAAPAFSDSSEFAEYIRQERLKWKKLEERIKKQS